MSNPTDTNQASEDKLRTLDEILSQAFTDGASDTMWQDERHIEIFATAKKELLGIIRTEKLKLLAEVRERVVGKNIDLTAEHIRKSFTVKEIPLLMKTNQLKNRQREQLTKLEAEL